MKFNFSDRKFKTIPFDYNEINKDNIDELEYRSIVALTVREELYRDCHPTESLSRQRKVEEAKENLKKIRKRKREILRENKNYIK